jgi:hypothetical protein
LVKKWLNCGEFPADRRSAFIPEKTKRNNGMVVGGKRESADVRSGLAKRNS